MGALRYTGVAIGGPRKGYTIESQVPMLTLARPPRGVVWPGEDDLAPVKISHGYYEYDAGHWWWKGWDK